MSVMGKTLAGWLRTSILGSVALGAYALAQTVPPVTLEDALRTLSDGAGVIFAGQVVGVRQLAGVVEIEFRVDRAIRGCTAGSTYALREWEGLWAGGDVRYRVGQRFMMLLRTPGTGGMSSPVGGMDGAIPIRGTESEIGAGAAIGAGGSVGPVATVDLRWVGARLARPVESEGDASAADGRMRRNARSVAGLTSGATTGRLAGSVSADASVAAQGASVDTVVGMLAAWEALRAAR